MVTVNYENRDGDGPFVRDWGRSSTQPRRVNAS